VGDLATVAAHLIKRGIRLVHVPTTLLAAVDSSVGGKGAVHIDGGRGRVIKNAAGVFHYPSETWLCPEFFNSLTTSQKREGQVEAWKMAVCLDGALWRRCISDALATNDLIRAARVLKQSVCRKDPYEQLGTRQVLNFGHTFGHVLESVTRFKLSHGNAVGLGILCALDVGQSLGVTSRALADPVESAFIGKLRIPGRARLQQAFQGQSQDTVRGLLLADKKVTSASEIKMVLLRTVGSTKIAAVPDHVWRRCFALWQRGGRP
jgi:3-dehydroquinate synthase